GDGGPPKVIISPSERGMMAGELKWGIDKYWRLKRRLKQLFPFLVVLALVPVLLLLPHSSSPPPLDNWPKAVVRGPTFAIASKRSTQPLALLKGGLTGIENIYLMKHGTYYPGENLADNSLRWMGVISHSGQTVTIRAYEVFDIVVAVRAKADGENLAYATKENIRVWLGASGAFTIPFNYAPDWKEYVFYSEGYGTPNGYLRMNVVWDNDGEGYLLFPGQELWIDNLILELWG
ncbi:MAG: hypothetical protein QXZ52_04870, partial [Candidatus Hadarchaeales archaeon]